MSILLIGFCTGFVEGRGKTNELCLTSGCQTTAGEQVYYKTVFSVFLCFSSRSQSSIKNLPSRLLRVKLLSLSGLLLQCDTDLQFLWEDCGVFFPCLKIMCYSSYLPH